MINVKQKHVFAAIGIILFFWMIYTQFFASIEELKFIDQYHFDKIVHFLGGVMITGMAIRYRGLSRVSALILLIFLGIGWEIFEVLFLSDVRDFYEKFYQYWLNDTLGDIMAGIMGGLCYAVFCKIYPPSQRDFSEKRGLA